MNDSRKKWNHNDFNFVNTNEFEPYVETNILIREEAEYLSKGFKEEIRNEMVLEQEPLVSNLSTLINNEEVIDNLKNSLLEVLPSKEVFENFENSMHSTLGKLDQIADLLKYNVTQQQEAANQKNERIEKQIEKLLEQQTQLYDPTRDPSFLQQRANEEEELVQSFQKMIDLKMDEANSQILTLVEELDDTKQKFGEILNSYEKTLAVVSEKQTELNTYLFESHGAISQLRADLNASKENYMKVENEISKIFSTWTENNKLLTKLESIIYDIGTSKLGYDQDLNDLLDEMKNKAIENQRSITDIKEEIASINEKVHLVNKNYEDLAAIHDENLKVIQSGIRALEEDANLQKAKTEDEFNIIKKSVNDEINYLNKNFEQEILKLKDADFQNLERIVGVELQVSKNAENIENLKRDVQELLDFEKTVDKILSSPIFQQSLEMKISNMITENNNYLGDEFKHKLDNFSTNVISDIDDVRKNNDDLLNSYQSLENKVLEISNNVDAIDHTGELKSQLEFLETNYKELYDKTADRIKENLTLIDNQVKGIKVDENELLQIINSSDALNKIIKDKTRQVIENQLDTVKADVNLIQLQLENNIKDFNEKILINQINDKISIEASKIKNESLNILYKELTKRDEKIDLNNEELVKNYETILECNKVLSNLEELVIKQTNEFDSYKIDKNDAISMLVDKIAKQKEKIVELEEKIKKNVTEFDFYGDSDSSKSLKHGLESWRLEFTNNLTQMVKGLVEDEIKKKAIVSEMVKENLKEAKTEIKNEYSSFDPFNYQPPSFSEENKKKRSDEFFINRVKDILNRLESSDLQKTYQEKFSLDKFFKINQVVINQEDKKIEEKKEIATTKVKKEVDDNKKTDYSEFVSNKN